MSRSHQADSESLLYSETVQIMKVPEVERGGVNSGSMFRSYPSTLAHKGGKSAIIQADRAGKGAERSYRVRNKNTVAPQGLKSQNFTRKSNRETRAALEKQQ